MTNKDSPILPDPISRRGFLQQTNALLVAGGVTGTLASNIAAAAPHASARNGSRKVRSIENVWIPMSDGTRIAARIWLPEDAWQQPVPALMEYVPYRKRDGTRAGDEQIHPRLASYGYACVRPDIRGSGDSDGLPQDEYVKKEQDDGVEIIAWLAEQPWCTGDVGMFGYSWGGFSALQVAARRPPALKAIITHCSSDDRYADDAHYTGGCINEGMFTWGSWWTLAGLQPPDPAIVGDGWRERWLRRLENVGFHLGDWLIHQHRDSFWKHGSVAEDYGSIECAVYAVGGWADPFRSTVARMLTHLKCPRKGLVGPWGHHYPQYGVPGPAIDWLTEALRWWDYWLKGIDTGVMSEPMYRVWMQESPAMRGMSAVSGRWVAEEAWPSARIITDTYFLNERGLGRSQGADTALVLTCPQTVGITAPRWFVTDPGAELPDDQRIDDVRSLSFDSEPLAADKDILGAPVVVLDLAVDKPVAFVIVRLNEVEPGGVSKRLSYGVLNLTHRNGHERPEALEPGRRYRIRLQLQDCAQTLKAGNRIRIALSTTYWPMIWPSPERVTLTLYAGTSLLELPARPPRLMDEQLRPFAPPVIPQNPQTGDVPKLPPASQVLEWDLKARKLTLRKVNHWQAFISGTATETSAERKEIAEILENDPTSAKLQYRWRMALKRGDWDVSYESEVRVRLSRNEFFVLGNVKAFSQGKEIFARTWDRILPRQLV